MAIKKTGPTGGLSRLISLLCSLLLSCSSLSATPFPVIGDIYDDQGKAVGKAHVYPRYVEIMDHSNRMAGKIGILVEEGIGKLFLVRQDNTRTLVGYAIPTETPNAGKILDREDKAKGTYFWTPTWSFIYRLDGKRAGKTKCIAWPRVCAAGVSSYLLGLFEPDDR